MDLSFGELHIQPLAVMRAAATNTFITNAGAKSVNENKNDRSCRLGSVAEDSPARAQRCRLPGFRETSTGTIVQLLERTFIRVGNPNMAETNLRSYHDADRHVD